MKRCILLFILICTFAEVSARPLLQKDSINQEQVFKTLIKEGRQLRQDGEYIRALELFNRGIDLAKEINNRRSIWDSFTVRGALMMEIGDHEQSRKDFKESLKYS